VKLGMEPRMPGCGVSSTDLCCYLASETDPALTSVPNVSAEVAAACRRAGFTTTYQLLGSFLTGMGRGATAEAAQAALAARLTRDGGVPHGAAADIAYCIAQKAATFMPEVLWAGTM
jgi:ABC-type sugar transport system substrate-binding protein